MALNNFLQGLNIVQSPASQSENNSRELLSAPSHSYPELDLWTTLAFQSDEPLIEDHQRDVQKNINRQQMQQHIPIPQHKNQAAPEQPLTGQLKLDLIQAQQGAPTFDLAAFLSAFGVQAGDIYQSGLNAQAQSLAQILTTQTASQSMPTAAPAAPAAPAILTNKPSLSLQTDIFAPPSKRVRSVSIVSNAGDLETSAVGGDETLNVTEDKRRRNTAASARFRLKKKEREQALEKHAKELETRVSALEKECEGLRRENGWLKGLVVGVTGANNVGNEPTRNRDANSKLENI